jgi:hypothetical protein
MPVPAHFQWTSVNGIGLLHPNKPIFKIEWNDDEAYVIKGETKSLSMKPDVNVQKATVHFGFQAMNLAAHGVDGRPLTPGEQQEFLNPNAPGRPTLTPSVKQRLESLGSTDLLVFMELVAGIVEMADAVFAGDSAEALLLLAAMQEEENLKRLGRIVVVDLFIGNLDRFNFDDVQKNRAVLDYTTGIENTKTKKTPMIGCVSNPTNVVFKKGTGVGERILIGFDPFDFKDGSADLDIKLSKVKEGRTKQYHIHGQEWQGTVMKDLVQMEGIAKITLNSLILALLVKYPDLDKATWKPSDQDYAHVLTGMRAAKADVIMVYNSRAGVMAGRNAAPDGVKNRLKKLKWIT